MVIIWIVLLLMFVGVSSFYYFYMRKFSRKPWNVKRNEEYFPSVTILVPAYNEEKNIRFKLDNLTNLDYPKDKLQIIIVNDGSTDGTLQEVHKFQEWKADVKIEVLDNSQRIGKTKALNMALKHATGEILIVSDADCFLNPDILRKALPFLWDSRVGAITGLEILLNSDESWVTETEIFYNDIVHTTRIGESKFHSTIFFQGGFGAYKRLWLDKFDMEADDSGTALNIVQKGARTLLLPEAIYFTTFPEKWRGKSITKLRRASQLIRIWFKCIKLFKKGKLVLPKRIFIPEAFLYLVNPLIFLFLIPVSILTIIEYPIFLLLFLIFGTTVLLHRKLRILLAEAIQDHLVLLGALFSLTFSRNFSLWSTADASRTCLTREMLETRGLI